MSYDKKLLEEQKKYGMVTCKVCRKRKVKDWNIYKNNICSTECQWKLIDRLLSSPQYKQLKSK